MWGQMKAVAVLCLHCGRLGRNVNDEPVVDHFLVQDVNSLSDYYFLVQDVIDLVFPCLD